MGEKPFRYQDSLPSKLDDKDIQDQIRFQVSRNNTKIKLSEDSVSKINKCRELVEQKDTVVFTFGRFNPPTTGHEKLIQKGEEEKNIVVELKTERQSTTLE